jgi:hypothetical protein
MILETNERKLSEELLLRILGYEGYDFSYNPGSVKYEVCKYTFTMWYEPDGFTYSKEVIESGEIPLTIELVNGWGQDDTPIFDYVIEQLQLTRI